MKRLWLGNAGRKYKGAETKKMDPVKLAADIEGLRVIGK